MTQLETGTSLYVALISAMLIRLDTVNASQVRCRPEYRNLPSGVIHTACKGPNPRCSLDRELNGLSDQVKRQALQAHNDYRSKVAKGQLPNYPPAKNMYELEWDDEMAEVAQAFAEQCDYTNPDRPEARTTSRFKSVGQCHGWAVDTAVENNTDVKTWIDYWFRECVDYSPNAVASFDTTSAKGVSDGGSEPGGGPAKPQVEHNQTGVRGSAAGGVVGSEGAGGLGYRIGQKVNAVDEETPAVGFTLLAAVTMFVAFLLGLCVGACVVSLCRRKTPKNYSAGAIASQNSGNMEMSSMSTMNY
ncbi:hypothetical protein HPB52_008979 [Rhipicephalus sanguineus]|uniref:SCP domain-containing protein n=1 Tax=Rhipicephalus sanguineus TaxID=34632 RepID=A0A9D4Q815_RHISA|nr:hypothetical protein HPB52_008979 [Rhipicephalus sanguineus]